MTDRRKQRKRNAGTNDVSECCLCETNGEGKQEGESVRESNEILVKIAGN
jgi:hypothetical protein